MRYSALILEPVPVHSPLFFVMIVRNYPLGSLVSHIPVKHDVSCENSIDKNDGNK